MSIQAFLILLITACILAGCAQGQEQQMQLALSLDVAHFKHTIEIKDDEFEPVAVFNTQHGFQEKRGLLGIVWSDDFLRGFLNKKNNTKTYQVYVSLKHQSKQWLFPYQAHYGRPLLISKATRIGSDVDCTASKYSGCTYSEYVVFTVPEKELRRVQENATPADFKTKIWKFKLKTKAGEDYVSGLLLPEVIALLEVMDGYQPIPPRQ